MAPIASPSHHDLSFVHLLTGKQFRLPHPPADFCRLLLSGGLVLAFLPTVGPVLQYCRLGDAEWRVASCSEAYVLEDLIFVKCTLHALVSFDDVELSDTNSVEFTFLGDQLDTQVAHQCLYFCIAECLDELLLVGATGDTPKQDGRSSRRVPATRRRGDGVGEEQSPQGFAKHNENYDGG
uniref:Uncharacterized protein n=1 Tax=Aegilops tauschii TaxID=37682 RepID=M8BHE0_AEGTA